MDDAPDVEAIAVDLRDLVKVRSRTALRDRVFPALDALLPESTDTDRELRYAARQALVDDGISSMTDVAHRQAADALLSSGPLRWRPLTTRGPKAAAEFRLGWDAYRRKRSGTDRSLLDETLDELAAALVGAGQRPASDDVATPGPPGDDPAVAPDVAAPGDGTTARVAIGEPVPTRRNTSEAEPRRAGRSRGRGAAVALAVAVGFALAAAVVALTLRDDDRRAGANASPPPLCGSFVHHVGDHAKGAPPAITRWAARFREQAAALGATSTCADLMEERDGIVYQQATAGEGDGVTALLGAVDGRTVVVLNHMEFVAYRNASWEEGNPTRKIGRPIRQTTGDDGARTTTFTEGILYQRAADSPAVSVVQAMYDQWQRSGGFAGSLGRPLSPRYDKPSLGSVQDFANGRVVVDYSASTNISVQPYTAEDRDFPTEVRNTVLVTAEPASSWYVDEAGTRHWLPTSNDFDCARLLHKATELRDIEPVAIDQLPLGKPFRCR